MSHDDQTEKKKSSISIDRKLYNDFSGYCLVRYGKSRAIGIGLEDSIRLMMHVPTEIAAQLLQMTPEEIQVKLNLGELGGP